MGNSKRKKLFDLIGKTATHRFNEKHSYIKKIKLIDKKPDGFYSNDQYLIYVPVVVVKVWTTKNFDYDMSMDILRFIKNYFQIKVNEIEKKFVKKLNYE